MAFERQQREVRHILDGLRPRQVALLKAIRSRPQVDDAMLREEYTEHGMLDFSVEVMTAFGFDWTRGRQDKSAHPFCSVALRVVFRDTDEGKHLLRVNLIDDDGANLLPKIEAPLEIRLPENQFFCTVNLVFNLQGLVFKKPGQYSLDVSLDGAMFARIPLQVLPMPTEGAGAS